MLPVICHLSLITGNMSHVTCHMSPFTCHHANSPKPKTKKISKHKKMVLSEASLEIRHLTRSLQLSRFRSLTEGTAHPQILTWERIHWKSKKKILTVTCHVNCVSSRHSQKCVTFLKLRTEVKNNFYLLGSIFLSNIFLKTFEFISTKRLEL